MAHQGLFSGSKSLVHEANTFLRNLKGNLHCLLLLAMHFTPRPPKLGKEGNDGVVGGGDEGGGATVEEGS